MSAQDNLQPHQFGKHIGAAPAKEKVTLLGRFFSVNNSATHRGEVKAYDYLGDRGAVGSK